MKRVPDVGNPWLDAGIVPFSTMGYRTNRAEWDTWYPAHWISESFPGQFRNWFYSLLAMATVVASQPPFRQIFGYGTLLAEDGRPMHKSWGNSIEFNEAADRMGVDVMRWLYCAHKPENDLLFGYNRGDEVRRSFLIPLWNVYSFFVTYAILDGWLPAHPFDPACPEGPAPASSNLLDRWILGRLSQVVGRVGDCLEESDTLNATLAVETFLDDLTNWYVRRSRRRFWKSEHDADKNDAYATLYHLLVKLARVLAPFTPFVTEAMYQNLVRSVRPEANKSVHHTAWPQAEPETVDGDLLAGMALARQIASLGLSARNSAGLKVRQPLQRALVHIAGDHAVGPDWNASPLRDIVMDELNVKDLVFVQQAGQLVTYRVLPDNKVLGPRFGARFPAVRQALAAADPAELAARVQAGQPVRLAVDGEQVELEPHEILVQTQPVEGLAVAADKLVTVAVDATVTPELRAEGLAREFVRRVQAMRKQAGFQIEDRIQTYYQTSGVLAAVVVNWADTIRSETLSTELISGQPPQLAYTEDHTLDGETVRIGVLRLQQATSAR